MPADTAEWSRYWINMAEPGYISVHCFRDSVWDQFPLFEGGVDLKWLSDWVKDHEARYHTPAELPRLMDQPG